MNPQLPPHITFIQRGWVHSNSILITGGNGPVIIDTGHHKDVPSTLAHISTHLNPADITLIVNTHCHWDHVGGNLALHELSGAPTAVSTATAHILNSHDRHQLWLDYFAADTPPVPAHICWEPGQTVQLGPYSFEIIAAPGHSPDSIVLYQPQTRLLISADALHLNDCGILNPIIHGENVLDAAIATVQTLQQRDIAIALPGHGPAITDVPASLHALAQKLARFQADPRQMALHLLRRVVMVSLMHHQPISRATFIHHTLAQPWPHDYAPRAGFSSPEAMLHHLLDDFKQRQLISEQNGRLTSHIPW
jgi:glyoxylase-like metal-dependent hydrolase (beta-lactamase superfamily II)